MFEELSYHAPLCVVLKGLSSLKSSLTMDEAQKQLELLTNEVRIISLTILS